jgi:hypothetical protein
VADEALVVLQKKKKRPLLFSLYHLGSVCPSILASWCQNKALQGLRRKTYSLEILQETPGITCVSKYLLYCPKGVPKEDPLTRRPLTRNKSKITPYWCTTEAKTLPHTVRCSQISPPGQASPSARAHACKRDARTVPTPWQKEDSAYHPKHAPLLLFSSSSTLPPSPFAKRKCAYINVNSILMAAIS